MAADPPAPNDPDNLLLVTAIGLPLKVTLTDFPSGSHPGDTIRLLMPEFEDPEWHDVVDDGAGNLIAELVVPPSHTTKDGTHPINYALRVGGGTSQPGPVDQFYLIDSKPPGGAHASPLVPEFDASNGVAFSNFSSGLPFHLYGYAGMGAGDEIFATVDGARMGLLTTVVDVSETKPIAVKLTADMLPIADGRHAFGYIIQDRQGTPAVASEQLFIDTIQNGVGTLIKPTVAGMDDGLLDFMDARVDGGATVNVPAIPDAVAGDVVYLRWAGRLVGAYRPAVTGAASEPFALTVPYGEIFAEWNAVSLGNDKKAPADVSYEVMRGLVRAGTSPVTAVTVNLWVPGGGGIADPDPETPGHESLFAPTVLSAGDDINEIPAEHYNRSATVRIPKASDTDQSDLVFLDDDIITVTFGTSDLTPYKYVVADEDPAADFVEIELPPADIDGQSGQINTFYTIAREIDGGTGHVASPVQLVKVTDPANAPGGGQPMQALTWNNSRHGPPAPTKAYAKDAAWGIRLDTFAYPNIAAGDVMVVNGVLAQELVHNSGEAEVSRFTRSEVVRDTDLAKGPVFWLRFEEVIGPNPGADLDKLFFHLHATYQVTSVEGASSAVSPDFILQLDMRATGDAVDPTRVVSPADSSPRRHTP